MDKRFKNTDIFKIRENEWNLDNILVEVEKIFKNLNDLELWNFHKIEWAIEKNKKNEELKKNIYKTLKIHVNELNKKKEIKKEHEYKIQIPELIHGQFFYVGGMLKTPIFQLYDKPIIYRNTSRGTILRFKNNAASVSLSIKKNNVYANLFSNTTNIKRNIPIEFLITALHSQNDFDLWWKKNITNSNEILDAIKLKCDDLWNNSTENDILKELGEYKTSANNVDKLPIGKYIKFCFKKAYDVDIFTQDHMTHNCILLELLQAIHDGEKSDTELDNKRIRFKEYILSELVKIVYDMVCTLHSTNKIKFKITQSIVTDKCNVSDIVHFNFPLNPVSEIASLLQCSLTGPGGFKKENVPAHMKNLDDSHYGKICPADTPDRDGCGVILNMVPGVKISNNGKFESESEIVCSYPITFTPFMQNDDQTRLQMASSQLKQTLLLENASPAMVKTGCESNYLNFSTFQNIAKMAGSVIHKDDNILVVLYDDSTIESFKIGYRNVCSNFADNILCSLSEGSKFRKNQVLCESQFIKNKEITLGQNLLTGVCIYDGYNYEDGIVISEEIVDKFSSVHSMDLSFEIESGQVLLSLDDETYKPLPNVGEKIKRGEIFAKIKHINGEDGFESINMDSLELAAQEDCIITSIEVYPNSWNKQIPQFNHFIKSYIDNQNKKVKILRDKLSKLYNMSKSEIDKFFILNNISHLETDQKQGNFVEKGTKINGVFVKINAIYTEKLSVGDKLSNRHGGKGVVSKILPKSEMPTLPDGRSLDIIINPLGIISRMNSGQLFELHISEALYQLKQQLHSIYKSEKTPISKLLKPLTEFLNIIDNTPTKWITSTTIERFEKEFKKDKFKAIENIQIIAPPFESTSPEQLFDAMKYCNAKFKYNLYNPITKKNFDNEIAAGYLYFLKLVHRASDKMIGRSIGPYNRNTLQPVGGKKNSGGHRIGEMEVWGFLAHGANDVLKELLTTHSDAPGKKNKLLSSILENDDLVAMDNSDDRPQSFRLLQASLTVLGLELTE